MANTQDLLRQRFSEACAERDTIAEQVHPLREQRDAIMAKAQVIVDKAAPLDDKIKELEKPLFNLHNEIATISRALGGKTAG